MAERPIVNQQRFDETRRVTVVGAVVNLVLSFLKILIGVVASSQALVADGIHSLSDLLTDAMVYFAAHHAHQAPDDEHPYGHGRFETIATMGLGLTLVAVAIGIMWDAGRRLFAPETLLQPAAMALVAAGVSILAKEGLYRYTIVVARKIRSKMLRANAWHHRSDAVSSIVVLVGIAGNLAGLDYLDAIAAILVGLMIAKMGWTMGWSSVQELADAGLHADRVQAIRDTIMSVGGVRAFHELRTRHVGGEALADVHVLVEPWLSVSEGHMISEMVRSRVVADIEEISDVTVHIDPEDDEASAPCGGLPLRSEVLRDLDRTWIEFEGYAQRSRVLLHYLDGQIHVDVFLPSQLYRSGEHLSQLNSKLSDAARSLGYVGKVQLFFGDAP